MKNERPASIEAVSVTKRFGTGSHMVTALDQVSLTIDGGEFFTLLGPSGCGKTTLLRMVAGFERADEGEVRLAGTALGDLPPFRRPVNTVFQSYALFPHLSVARNVAFGLEMQGRPRAEVDAGVASALAMVRMAELAGRLPRQLSGGQQQRVALARALACRPRVLLLDEPLSALDLQLRKEMQGELRRLKAQTGITFLFVTHDQEEALTMSDRLAVMDRGRVLQVGTPAEIYDRPASRFVAGFIGETNFIEAPCTGADGARARFELPGGGSVVLERPDGIERGAAATLAIRPERVEIVDAGGIVARLDEVVYLGTDSVCHLSLVDGSRVRARLQNRGGWRAPPQPGDTVQLRFPTDALRALPA